MQSSKRAAITNYVKNDEKKKIANETIGINIGSLSGEKT